MARAESHTEGAYDWSADGWRLHVAGDQPDREGWAATMLALSNGAIGVRGAIEERSTASTFLAHAYEQSPIRYHERLHGFAPSTDSRVPVAEPLGLDIRIDGIALRLDTASSLTQRTLDFRTGVLSRRTRWTLEDGRTLTVDAERLVPLDGRTVLLRRLRARLEGANVTVHPRLAPAPPSAAPSDDPRMGVALTTAGFQTERASDDLVVERLSGSGIAVAVVQRRHDDDGWTTVADGYAVGREKTALLVDDATALTDTMLAGGFTQAVSVQTTLLADFWGQAEVTIDGDPCLTAALRCNLFHLFTSAGRDGRSSAAAKGLTGEGYEGHYFWDAEAFMLPVLAVVAPPIARAMLLYRAGTLDAAMANARALDHPRGALYAWRTIEGRECSAHYPSGSAQYHLNAAIAFAIGLYVDATGDDAFLIDHGARMLVETARLWLVLGDFRDGAFHLCGVTGPDEYTALIDDNWYTNRMAQKHLRLTVQAVRTVQAHAPESRAALQVDEDELTAFSHAADAMYLPFDAARDLDAQDASFLDKPRWDVAGTPAEHFPLLLHHHPMTLYRHQVAKQADLILGLVLGGEEVPRERKQRAFAHYEPITTHDSTLSASTFAILAAEIGREEDSLRFLGNTAFVDLDDQHGNTDHGIHMAALAGSWMALVWGFAGFRPTGPRLSFRPTRPRAWRGYRFRLVWRSTTVEVAVAGDDVSYRAVDGPAIILGHHDAEVHLLSGETRTVGLAP